MLFYSRRSSIAYLLFFLAVLLLYFTSFFLTKEKLFVYFWPVNTVAAILVVYLRKFQRRSNYYWLYYYCTFIVIGLNVSLWSNHKLEISTALTLVVIGSLQMVFLPKMMLWMTKALPSSGSARKTNSIFLPVFASCLLQSLFFLGYLMLCQPETIEFRYLDWLSEQLATAVIVTMILYPLRKRRLGFFTATFKVNYLLYFMLMVTVQLAIANNYWLMLCSIAILPCLLSVRYIGFYPSVLFSGVFLLFIYLFKAHYYLHINTADLSGNYYREVFSYRFNLVLTGIVSVFIGEVISYKRKSLGKINQQARTDFLTKLYNRRYCYGQMQQLVAGKRVGLIMIDVDDFKVINDTFGHEMGDRVLVEIATKLRTVPLNGGILSRWGGEEFFLCLPVTDQKMLADYCQKLLNLVRDIRLSHEQGELAVTISCGATLCSEFTGDIDDFLSQADKMLYQAKTAGKNCFFVNTI